MCLPNSSDFSPVDYKICGMRQECVYQKPARDVDELKQRLIETWSRIKQSVINEATDQWRDSLNTSVKAKDKHFEHLL